MVNCSGVTGINLSYNQCSDLGEDGIDQGVCIHTEGKFALDEFSGRLYSNIEFDREAQDVYDITIKAFRVEFLTKRSVQSSKLTFHERYLLNNMVGYHHYV